MRSRKVTRCGEVKSPVRMPAARSDRVEHRADGAFAIRAGDVEELRARRIDPDAERVGRAAGCSPSPSLMP